MSAWDQVWFPIRCPSSAICFTNSSFPSIFYPIRKKVAKQTKAQYAFLTNNGEWNPEIISVDYDIERTAEEFSSSGLLEKSAVWGRGLLGTIRTGINYTVLAVRLVEKYSQETGLPVTDESLWERAAKELQIP